jgi:hypothetical protein
MTKPGKGSKKNYTRKAHKKCCDATFHGIEKWFKAMFEHLGWMLLAKDKGMYDKIAVYKNSLQHLKNSIENALAEIKDQDKKRDLKIMHHDVLILIDHVNKDFA